ncbi:hypothetical protein BST97_13200 [Nonlabens spongiae]|uniref:Uncharacterized protein n=1 Tax=Nonlabens spongiae TaxID=331648 RepID=A0A1W6MMP3_9FLAO|nr:hypothetical protein [Nonlabens spongiae]ARN78868.1 hypothetical protein BST97_13200 [Nonlabens spongiae]
METTNLPLANWGNGTIMIGVFALVCIVLVAVIYNMVNSKPADQTNDKTTDLDSDSKTLNT